MKKMRHKTETTTHTHYLIQIAVAGEEHYHAIRNNRTDIQNGHAKLSNHLTITTFLKAELEQLL